MQECKLPVSVDEYVARFKPHMCEIVYAWARGAKFIEICKMTDIFEGESFLYKFKFSSADTSAGSIIRTMRRLEELLRELCSAAKAIGNTELEAKFADAITKIKRDIVFAASLYL